MVKNQTDQIKMIWTPVNNIQTIVSDEYEKKKKSKNKIRLLFPSLKQNWFLQS